MEQNGQIWHNNVVFFVFRIADNGNGNNKNR